EKNFSHSSAYAPLRRKTKRARRKVRHNNDKDTTTTKTQQQQRQKQHKKTFRIDIRFAAFARLKNWVLQEIYNADICRRFCGI
ncbi:MAG: hypothetical protein LBC07_04425, partial [Elusimicrobiota bacterium]|nr:hypothetical protein [Elusimicrobiota bacterium]